MSAKEDIYNLIQMLDTQGDKAAEKVIGQLLEIGKPAVPSLVQAVKSDPSPRVRKWALQALGAIGDKRGAPFLVEALKDKRMTVRLHALRGLGRMKYKKAVVEVSNLLDDESGGIRSNALQTLIDFGDSAALPKIQKSLSDSKWYVRQLACRAIGELKGTKIKKKLSELAENDEKKAVREAAQQALAKLG